MENIKNIDELIKLSLINNGTQIIREKLKIKSAYDFVKYIANQKNISIKEAQNLISNDIKLMKIMFCIA